MKKKKLPFDGIIYGLICGMLFGIWLIPSIAHASGDLEFTGKQAVHKVEAFDYWVAYVPDRDFDHLSDAQRVAMSLDLLVEEMNPPEVNSTGPEEAVYWAFYREDAERVLRSYFGSDFSPTDADYQEAGYIVENEWFWFRLGDWGMDPPSTMVLDAYMDGSDEFVYDMVYWSPEENGEISELSDENTLCYVTWRFRWDEGQGNYVISDMSYAKNSYYGGGSSSSLSEEYILPDSDSRYYDASELMGLSKEQLRLARNEIYARLGRRFNSADLQAYFDSCSWYQGIYDPDSFDESWLNKYEKANANLILKIENGATSKNDLYPYSEQDIVNMVYDYYHAKIPKAKMYVDLEGSDGEMVDVHVYEIKDNHTATYGWYTVSRSTGAGIDTTLYDEWIDFSEGYHGEN